MKLLCPNCQKELIVDDQYAGQNMNCPLCQEMFVAPAMTDFQTREPEEPLASPDEPADDEPIATAKPEGTLEPESVSVGEKTPPTPAAPGDYRRLAITLRPDVIRWLPVIALLVTGLLTWTTWVWVGYGTTRVITQNGVQAAFGLRSENKALIDKGIDADIGAMRPATKISRDGVGPAVLTIFFLLVLFGAFVLSAALAVLPYLPIQMPAQAQMILPWKWAIAGSVILFALVFYSLQLAIGFNMEHVVYQEATLAHQTEGTLPGDIILAGLHRTGVVTVIFWLLVVALVSAAIMFINDIRKDAPPPRIDVLW